MTHSTHYDKTLDSRWRHIGGSVDASPADEVNTLQEHDREKRFVRVVATAKFSKQCGPNVAEQLRPSINRARLPSPRGDCGATMDRCPVTHARNAKNSRQTQLFDNTKAFSLMAVRSYDIPCKRWAEVGRSRQKSPKGDYLQFC